MPVLVELSDTERSFLLIYHSMNYVQFHMKIRMHFYFSRRDILSFLFHIHVYRLVVSDVFLKIRWLANECWKRKSNESNSKWFHVRCSVIKNEREEELSLRVRHGRVPLRTNAVPRTRVPLYQAGVLTLLVRIDNREWLFEKRLQGYRFEWARGLIEGM